MENGSIIGINFNPVKFNKKLLKYLPLRSVGVFSVVLFQLPFSMKFLRDLCCRLAIFLKFAATDFFWLELTEISPGN